MRRTSLGGMEREGRAQDIAVKRKRVRVSFSVRSWVSGTCVRENEKEISFSKSEHESRSQTARKEVSDDEVLRGKYACSHDLFPRKKLVVHTTTLDSLCGWCLP